MVLLTVFFYHLWGFDRVTSFPAPIHPLGGGVEPFSLVGHGKVLKGGSALGDQLTVSNFLYTANKIIFCGANSNQ